MKRRIIVFASVLTVGLSFIAYGLWRGEAQTVFDKAVAICLQCIGLG